MSSNKEGWKALVEQLGDQKGLDLKYVVLESCEPWYSMINMWSKDDWMGPFGDRFWACVDLKSCSTRHMMYDFIGKFASNGTGVRLRSGKDSRSLEGYGMI